MEDPKGVKVLGLFGSPSSSFWKYKKIQSYVKLSMSQHAMQACPLLCSYAIQALEASLSPAPFLYPPSNWRTGLRSSKITQIHLRREPDFSCKAELLFRGTCASAHLWVRLWGEERSCFSSIRSSLTTGFYINPVLQACVLQALVFES